MQLVNRRLIQADPHLSLSEMKKPSRYYVHQDISPKVADIKEITLGEVLFDNIRAFSYAISQMHSKQLKDDFVRRLKETRLIKVEVLAKQIRNVDR